jgi:hypothetical protein
VTAVFTLDEHMQTREVGRRTNPLRAILADGAVGVRDFGVPAIETAPALAPAVTRQIGQLPAITPLLDCVEIAGWSSHRRSLSANFHDWLMLEGGAVLVIVGQAVGPQPIDPTEAALVAQATWATIRAHAHHVRDAGRLLSIAARSLWPTPNASIQAAVAIAMLDATEGHASVAIAGNCLAWRVRAAISEQLAVRQPMLGEAAEFTYPAHSVQLSLRERLVLVADDPLRRSAKLATSIAATFAGLDAESHRRMLATDAVALVRRHYEAGADDVRSPASIVAIRRR